jgi:hypothetical protein
MTTVIFKPESSIFQFNLFDALHLLSYHSFEDHDEGAADLLRFLKSSSNNTKSLSLNKLLRLNPPLKKGDLGGFGLARLGEIPPTPLYKGGNIIYGQALTKFLLKMNFSLTSF